MSNIKFKHVDIKQCEFIGPFECIVCGGHLMVDFSFIDQVFEEITCPYCNVMGDCEDDNEKEDYT